MKLATRVNILYSAEYFVVIVFCIALITFMILYFMDDKQKYAKVSRITLIVWVSLSILSGVLEKISVPIRRELGRQREHYKVYYNNAEAEIEKSAKEDIKYIYYNEQTIDIQSLNRYNVVYDDNNEVIYVTDNV